MRSDLRRPLKIAVTGAHGVGKTTLANAVAALLGDELEVVVTDEVPRRIARDVGDPEFFRRGHNTFERQRLILMAQVTAEAAATALLPDVVLCDRTIVDHWAYIRVLFPAARELDETRVWERLVQDWARTYELVVAVRPEFPPLDDGTREPDVGFQASVDTELFPIYEAWGIPTSPVAGSLEARSTAAAEYVRASLGARR